MVLISRKTAVVVHARNRLLFHPAELPNLVGKQPAASHAHVTAIQPGTRLLLPSTDARTEHLRNVLKVQQGDFIKVGVVNGPAAIAQVLPAPHITGSPAAHDVRLEITEVQEVASPGNVDLLLALPRPKVLKRLWPVIAELGVGCVILTNAARVEKTYWAAGAALDSEQIETGFIRGLEQAGCTRLPEVVLSKTLKGALLHLEQRARVRALRQAKQQPGAQQGQPSGLKPGAQGSNAAGVVCQEVANAACADASHVHTSQRKEGGGVIMGHVSQVAQGSLKSVAALDTGASEPVPDAGTTKLKRKVQLAEQDGFLVQDQEGKALAQGQVNSGKAIDAHQQRVEKNGGLPGLPWGVSYLAGSWADFAPDGALLNDDLLHAPSWQALVQTDGYSRDPSELRVVAHPYVETPLLHVLQQHVDGHGWECIATPQVPFAVHAKDAVAAVGSDVACASRPRVVVAVGPEGGWWPDELQMLTEVGGFVPASLGPRILTSTTAVVTLVSCANQVLLQQRLPRV